MAPSTVEAKRLLAVVERLERLEEDKRQISEVIEDVCAEARRTGYDVKILCRIIAIRKQDRDKRHEEEGLTLYLAALGMDA